MSASTPIPPEAREAAEKVFNGEFSKFQPFNKLVRKFQKLFTRALDAQTKELARLREDVANANEQVIAVEGSLSVARAENERLTRERDAAKANEAATNRNLDDWIKRAGVKDARIATLEQQAREMRGLVSEAFELAVHTTCSVPESVPLCGQARMWLDNAKDYTTPECVKKAFEMDVARNATAATNEGGSEG